MAQKKYLFLGLTAMLALALTLTVAVRELTVTDARTADATMSMTVTAGGACVGSTCTVPPSGAFTLQVNAVVPPTEGYIGIQTEVDYAQLVTNGGSYKPRATAPLEIVWVDSDAFELRVINVPGIATHGAATGSTPPFPVSHAVGALVQLDFNCGDTNSSNVLTLVPLGPGNTNASGYKGAGAGFPGIPAKAAGTLTINCGSAPTPTPTTPVEATPTATATAPEGTATPTPTSGPATATPTAGPPTNTPTVTNTPGPTNTPAPATPTRTPTRTPTPSEEQNGDANCNGVVNSVDALWILWDVAGISDLIPCPELADTDKDGDITSVDAALVLQFEAGLIGLA